MAMQKWFPLGIFAADIAGYSEHKKNIVDHIYSLRENSGEKRSSKKYNWTGDIHGVDAIHADPVFGWLTKQLEQNVIAYLTELGHNLDRLDVHIQRSWPVIGKRGQRVKRHAHNTAHLSSVCYISVPDDAKKSGQISFYNSDRPNELSPGMGSSMTKAYSDFNLFNHKYASYTPKEGLLLLFPAKTQHEVDENLTGEDRISVSFDIIVTSREDAEGKDEFLMPSPTKWKAIDMPSRSSNKSASAETKKEPAPSEVSGNLLTKITKFHRSADLYMLAPMENHVLWETRRFLHVSNRVDGIRYSKSIAASDQSKWEELDGKRHKVRGGGSNLTAYANAADRLYCYLRERNVSAAGATLTSARVERLADLSSPKMVRGDHHLSIYVRLDHDTRNSVFVKFSDGSREEIGPGDLVFASGSRSHGLGGTGEVLSFAADIPSVGRLDVLGRSKFKDQKIEDDVVFCCSTALPIGAPTPEADLMVTKLKRDASLKRRKFKREECPVINRFLVQSVDPSKANADEIARIQNYGRKGDKRPGDDPIILEDVDVLSESDCEKLRTYAADNMTSVVPDTVDDLPEYQVDISHRRLGKIIGTEKADAVYKLPELLGAPSDTPVKDVAKKTSLFIRKYSPDTRPNIAFHADRCRYTTNIALNANSEFEGGELLAMSGDRLKKVSRKTGKAVLHAGNVVHGVTQTTKGVRWSLILFYKE